MAQSDSPPTILVADDETLILATLSRGLRNAGFHIIEATDGKEAVELGIKHLPALALLDINMPGISGIEAARRLNEEAGVHSLFLSAYDDSELVDQAINEGALGYLVKPIDIRQIIPSIEAALVRSRELKALLKNRENLVAALAQNKDISLAIGIYMERFEVNETEAYETLRSYARSERRKLLDVATELVEVTDKRNEMINKIHHAKSAPGKAGRKS